MEAIAQTATLPDYLVDTYTWAYLRPRSLRLRDRHCVVNGILWGNYRRLVAWACDEFSAGDRLLQAASAYGNLSLRLAERVGQPQNRILKPASAVRGAPGRAPAGRSATL